MCQRHRDEVGPAPSPIASIFDAVFSGRRPSSEAVADATFDVIEAFMGRRLTPEERARAQAMGGGVFGGAGSSSSRASRSSSEDASSSAGRTQEAAERERAQAIGRARRTLGFSAREALTPELLKQRYRELAKKWHPDRFAHDPAKQKVAERRMQEINAAMEVLTKPV